MILTLTLAFCGFVVIIAGILALNGMMRGNDYKVKPYDTTIYPDQAVEIVKQIAAYKTNFKYHQSSDSRAVNEIEFIDTKNVVILKVSKVSCYSDITGIKNHQGYLYSIIKDYVVLKNYISLDECMRDYQQNYCLFVKKGKIADRLRSLQEDF